MEKKLGEGWRFERKEEDDYDSRKRGENNKKKERKNKERNVGNWDGDLFLGSPE